MEANTPYTPIVSKRLGAAPGALFAFNHIFVEDLKDYAAMNEVYREFFPAQPPARSFWWRSRRSLTFECILWAGRE